MLTSNQVKNHMAIYDYKIASKRNDDLTVSVYISYNLIKKEYKVQYMSEETYTESLFTSLDEAIQAYNEIEVNDV